METRTASFLPAADIGRTPVIPIRPLNKPMEEKPTLRQVFDAEESPLLRYAHGLVGQRETAEDLVQDAFLKLQSHWDEVIHPRAWLFRCVRNLALSHIRDHKRETPMENGREWESSTPDPEKSPRQTRSHRHPSIVSRRTSRRRPRPHFPQIPRRPQIRTDQPTHRPQRRQRRLQTPPRLEKSRRFPPPPRCGVSRGLKNLPPP
jgi:hypothetical protein